MINSYNSIPLLHNENKLEFNQFERLGLIPSIRVRTHGQHYNQARQGYFIHKNFNP